MYISGSDILYCEPREGSNSPVQSEGLSALQRVQAPNPTISIISNNEWHISVNQWGAHFVAQSSPAVESEVPHPFTHEWRDWVKITYSERQPNGTLTRLGPLLYNTQRLPDADRVRTTSSFLQSIANNNF